MMSSDVSRYRVIEPVKHAGLIHWPGDEIPMPEDEAAALVAAGVICPAIESAPPAIESGTTKPKRGK